MRAVVEIAGKGTRAGKERVDGVDGEKTNESQDR